MSDSDSDDDIPIMVKIRDQLKKEKKIIKKEPKIRGEKKFEWEVDENPTHMPKKAQFGWRGREIEIDENPTPKPQKAQFGWRGREIEIDENPTPMPKKAQYEWQKTESKKLGEIYKRETPLEKIKERNIGGSRSLWHFIPIPPIFLRLLGDNFSRIYTMGEGDCLFHAYIGADDPTYFNEDSDGKRVRAISLREHLAKEINDQTIINCYQPIWLERHGAIMNRDTIKLLVENTKERMRSIGTFCGNEEWNILACLGGKNLLIFNGRDEIIYRADTNRRGRPYIFIYGTGGHYETIVERTAEGRIRTIFDENSNIVRTILASNLFHDNRQI